MRILGGDLLGDSCPSPMALDGVHSHHPSRGTTADPIETGRECAKKKAEVSMAREVVEAYRRRRKGMRSRAVLMATLEIGS